MATLTIYFLGGSDEATPRIPLLCPVAVGLGKEVAFFYFCFWPRTFDYASSRPRASRLFLKRAMW